MTANNRFLLILLGIFCFGNAAVFAQINVDSINALDTVRPRQTAKPSMRPGVDMNNILKDTQEHIIVKPVEVRRGFGWKDTVIVPKRSAFYSILFPGLGQINNRQYWKLPIVYGLLGAGVYFFQDNLKNYNRFRRIYINRKNLIFNDDYPYYDLQQIQNERDYYKKFLDITVLLTAVGYGLQIMDANVFAHLKGFDISDDISLQMKPSFQTTPLGISPGMGIALKF